MSRITKPLALAATVVALCLPLSACGGSSDNDKAAKAISKSMVSASNSTFKVSQKQADCVGKEMVSKVGVDKLKKYGVLTKNLTADNSVTNVKMSKSDATGAADSITDCTDAASLMRKAMLGSQNLGATEVACINKVFTKNVVHELFVDVFSGDTAGAQTVISGPVTQCVKGS